MCKHTVDIKIEFIDGIGDSFAECMLCLVANVTLQWRHDWLDGVSNYQPYDCLLNRLFRRISKKTAKLRVTGLCP